MNQRNSEKQRKIELFWELVKITNYNFFSQRIVFGKKTGERILKLIFITILIDVKYLFFIKFAVLYLLSGVGYHISKVCGKEEVLI